ncbi:acylphosphatase [Sphingomonas yabuuchiae]|uniref:acylphosphatase n=1 Tax=Sphingomonas yabuuchiae TaxID=172044 RepID=UPI003D95F21D
MLRMVPLPVPGRIDAFPFTLSRATVAGMIGRHLCITGRVQGVGYPYWFLARAESLGLTGWVRNRADGSVEAVIQGLDAAVIQMIADAADGPSTARVDLVLPHDHKVDATLARFEQRPTC